MPISIYISVNEDERVGGYPGFPRNKTCSNAFHQGKGGDRKKEKNIAQLKKMLKERLQTATINPNGLKAVHDNGTHQVARRTNCCFNKSVTQ